MAAALDHSSGVGLLREGGRQASRLLTTRNLLLVILALALWWRLVYVTELPGQSIPGVAPLLHRLQGDAVSYDSVATNLLDGKGYLNSAGENPVPPPVYPTFLAGVYAGSAHSFMAARIVLAIIGAATCGVIFLIGRKAFNPATGLVAALLAAAYPWFIVWSRWLSTETLFIFILSLGILVMLWAGEKPVPRNLALAGFLLALANLTHTTAPILPVLFAGWLLLVLGLRKGAKAGGIFLGVFLLTLMPWAVRNYIHYQEFIPVSAHGGVNLYTANNPYANPDKPHYSDREDVDPADMREVEGKPFLEKDRILRNKAIKFIVDNPRTFLSNGWKRVKLFWESVPLHDRGLHVFNTPLLRSEQFGQRIDYVLVVMFAVGAIAALRRWRTAIVLLLVPLQFSLLHVFFPVMPAGRSRVVTMQVAVILAAFAVYATWSVITAAPLWAPAIRAGIKERSLESTWRLIKSP